VTFRRVLPVVLVVGAAAFVSWRWPGAPVRDRAPREPQQPEAATSDARPAHPPAESSADALDFRGLVVDAEGRPVAGARVGLRWGTLATSSDVEGRFTLAAPEPGTQEIEIDASGFARRMLVMAAGAETRVVLLRGAVLAGTVQRADGSSAPNAHVQVADLETEADAEGRFRLEGIPPGICRVRARTADHIDAPDTEYDLEFLPDEHRVGYVILIDRATRSYLEVHLVDDAGGPLTGWTLYDPWHEIIQSGDAGESGRFQLEFAGAPGEDVLLTANPPEEREGELLYLQKYARTHARPGGEPIVMRVPRAVRVTFVGRGPGGVPLRAGAELHVKCWNSPSSEVDRGSNEPADRVTKLVHEGDEYTLGAWADGYVREDEDWTAPPGGGTVEVILQPLGRIRGRLLAPDGTPVCRAWFGPGRSANPALEDLARDGSFLRTPPKVGRFRFSVGTDPRMPGLQRDIDLPPGGIVDLGEVRLEPATTLRGKTIDDRGDPVRGARVEFDTDLYAYLPHDTLTDEEGSFSIPAPSFATGVLTVHAEGRGTAVVEVSDVREPVTITLHSPARAEVFVEIDPSIAPQTYDLHVACKLPSGAVRWRYVARPIWQSGTRRFLVTALAPGPTLFRAKTPWDHVGLTEVDVKPGEEHRVAVRVR
jgi:hypothetical protein